MSENIFERYEELEGKAQKVIKEQPKLEASRDLLKTEVAKKMKELKEKGVEFSDKQELQQRLDESKENLKLSLDSLERRLNEYEEIRKEADNNLIENTEKNNIDDVGSAY